MGFQSAPKLAYVTSKVLTETGHSPVDLVLPFKITFLCSELVKYCGVCVAEKRTKKDASRIDDFAKVKIEDEKEQVKVIIKRLLAPHKTIRDAIHKDIFVTRLETAIIDTQVFQRLRRLKQLGLTNLIYPSANHTRLEHSIGTLFMADFMIDKINRNPFAETTIEPPDRFIIRLIALLHDLGNLPFGHTLEDEGRLFDSQWSPNRIDYFLGDTSEVGKVILVDPNLRDLSRLGQTRFNPENVTKEIRQTLQLIEEGKPEELQKPYIADIVGNTLCADLLDYSKRDVYFTGLTSGYDDRILSYLYITEHGGKDRLVLRLIKPSKGQIRRDVLSEMMDLLRLRYSLAEKVYFHQAKMIASAMLISAVTSMSQENRLPLDTLYKLDDDTLLYKLFSEGSDIAKHLVTRIRERRLYKVVYDLSYSKGITQSEYQQKTEIINQLTNPKTRYERERLLENMSASSTTVRKNPGSIVIYCPPRKMGMKEVETLVDWGTGKGPLKDIEEDRIKGEISTSVTEKHGELWRMIVIVDPEIPRNERCYINESCQELFGLPSVIKDYQINPHGYIDRHATRWEEENPAEPRLQHAEVEAIKAQLPTRGPERDESLTYDAFCKEVRNIRAQNKD